jgi:F-BAR domain only protein
MEAAGIMADSHEALATKLDVDVERPLRDFAPTNRQMTLMTTVRDNLAAVAKEVEKAQQKMDKLMSKGDKAEAGKVSAAIAESEEVQAQWKSQAPEAFASLQAMDEARINHLRDVLTQYQTNEVDLAQKAETQQKAEKCLNQLLSLQTEDEISIFALRAAEGKARHHRASHSGPSGSASTSRMTPSRGQGSSTLTPQISQQDDESQRSGSMQEKKSRFGGLKRLGTVVGGNRRQSKMPAGASALPSMLESPEKKPSKSPFSFGRKGKSKQTAALEIPEESPTQERPNLPAPIGSEIMESPQIATDGHSSPTPAHPTMNGTASAAGSIPTFGSSIPNGSHQDDLTGLDPPRPTAPVIEEPEKDSEGFSIPQRNLDPISQAQAEAAAAGETTGPAYNVNIRDRPIQEDGAASESLLASAATKLVSDEVCRLQ